MSEPLSEIAVVREKNEAFGLRVETADVEKPGKFVGQKIEDGVTSVYIFSRRDKTHGFVQHDSEQRFGMNKLAMHFHVVARTRLRAEIRADLAVNGDMARGN